MSSTFGHRLAATIATHGPLCVGIDPHTHLLGEWGLPDDASGAREFGLRVIDAAHGRAGIVKPQVAFFERFGSAGFAALESVLSAARSAGLLVIADAKRGDIGSSVTAYAEAWLLPGSPMESDAMTVHAYQGFPSLDGCLDLAQAHGKGLFVLAATSNPEAFALQTAVISNGRHSGLTVAASIVADVNERNARHGSSPTGDIGVVLGATVDLEGLGIDLGTLAAEPATPVLAPGFGHQGARLADVASIYGAAARATIVSASRSILAAGPDGISEAISRHASDIAGVRS